MVGECEYRIVCGHVETGRETGRTIERGQVVARLATHFAETSSDVNQVVCHQQRLHNIAIDSAHRGIPRRGDAAAGIKGCQVQTDGVLPDESHLIETASGVYERARDG